MFKNRVTLEVCINGIPVTEYTKDGKTYIEGRKGSKYSLRLRNHTGERICAVVTVDGLSVIEGKKGSYDSPGYVLNPGQIYDIEGWRINNNQIREFNFTKHTASYSNKVGEGTDNLGVIGLAVFKEDRQPFYITNTLYEEYKKPERYTLVADNAYNGPIIMSLNCSSGENWTKGSTNAHINRDYPMLRSSVGTGMGSKKEAHVVTTEFVRQILPYTEMAIYYYERKQLEKMGIIHKVPIRPNPFPAEEKFCQEV